MSEDKGLKPESKSLSSQQRKPSKPGGGAFSKYRRAAQESKERNVATSDIWGEVWNARKAFDGWGRYRLEKNQSADAVLLNEGYAIIAHKVNYGWNKGNNRSFARKDDVRCLAWTLDDDGRWVPTGKKCPLCILLGRDPRLVVLWALLDSREELIRKENVVKSWTLKYMALDNDVIRGNIWDGVEIYAEDHETDPTTIRAMFRVSRGSDPKGNAYGASWTFARYVDDDTKEVVGALPRIPNWDDAWPVFDEKVLTQVARKHMALCDEHLNGGGYDATGAAKLFSGATEAPASDSKSLGSGSLEDQKAEETAAEKTPRLQDMPNLDGDDEAPAPEAKVAAETGTEGTEGEDGFNPWKDEQL